MTHYTRPFPMAPPNGEGKLMEIAVQYANEAVQLDILFNENILTLLNKVFFCG